MEQTVPEEPKTALAWLAIGVAGVALLTSLGVESAAARAHLLRASLLLLAAVEGLFGALALFAPRRFETQARALYVRQHIGLYNLFAVTLYGLAALDPLANLGLVRAVIALYVIHAGYELCCYMGLAPAAQDPWRQRRAYLIDAVTLLAVISPVVLFYPGR